MTKKWIWQYKTWPTFTYNEASLLPQLRLVRFKLGELIGTSQAYSGTLEQELNTLLSNIVASSAIENDKVNASSVRSSLAKRLGLAEDKPYPVSDKSEGLAEMMLDAVKNKHDQLTLNQLLVWHQYLFPTKEWRLHDVNVGELRGEEPMQVVSGRIDRPVVHFEAPPRQGLEEQLQQFIGWFNQSLNDTALDPYIRAAICHLWFVTLHPFDDGNGRLTRALTDKALAQADNQTYRLYTMSSVILKNREAYYDILSKTQQGNTDITEWVNWFLDMLLASIDQSLAIIQRTMQKTKFWYQHRKTPLSEEQIKVLNRLLDGGENGFEQGISASQYQKVAKVSKATATRHLTDLLEKGCLEKLPGAGRSTRYQINQ